MHNIKKVFLIIPIFLFVSCKKDEILAPQKEEKEIFQFEYVTKDGDLDLSEFTYSMPDDYFHLTIKEIVYEYDKEVTEKIILEQDLEKTSGVIQIQKESITSENTQLNFNVPISSEKSFVSSSDFPIPSDYFNLFGANITKVNDRKINLYAYKGKKVDDSKGSIQLTNQVFNENYDISDSLEKNEVIIIWSCEFSKE